MKLSKAIILFFISILFIQNATKLHACSMYKLTLGGKTVVGCNEDAWRLNSVIWFEEARNENEYGAAFTGSRMVSPNKFAPQSGMNEAGLVFSRLESYFPENKTKEPNLKPISNEVAHLTDVLHQCKTVEEVKLFVSQYDYSIFLKDVFIYIDSAGNYLVVEPYNLIQGNDAQYVLSNFCPSITNHKKARKLERYKNGFDFLEKHQIDTSLTFTTALSDTMHVCRSRNGDGTLLTSIWDTKNGLVNLYFYHNFDTTVQFKLKDELAKGNHLLNIPEMFPANSEFKRLADYKTPFNMPFIRVGLIVFAVLFAFLFLYFTSLFIKHLALNKIHKVDLVFAFLNLLLVFYLTVLATNMYIFYFDAPYKKPNSILISASSYIPFLLLVCVPFLYFYSLKNKYKSLIYKGLTTFNLSLYLVLLVVFSYWGFFNVF